MLNITTKMADLVSEQVKAYFSNPSLETSVSTDGAETFFFNRMSLILVANADFRLLIKVHCNECDIKSLAKEALSLSKIEAETGLIDYIKELTNLLGGTLKRSLESAHIQCGLSLPLITKGFDELFAEKMKSAEASFFSLSNKGQKITVQIHLDFLSDKAKEMLSAVDFSNAKNSSGDFEFL